MQKQDSGLPSSSSDNLPRGWQWLENLINMAHLPYLGLPTKWNETQEEHIKIAYDPKNKKAYNLKSDTISNQSLSFIKSTAGKNVMPGTKTPAAARFHLYSDSRLQAYAIKDYEGNMLVPCFAEGDYVKVESLQTDHAQAKEEIRKRQQELIEILNTNLDLADKVLALDGMNKFFVKTSFPKKVDNKTGEITDYGKEKIYGTLFFYELYFNDIDNLWLICQACNLHKSNQNTLDWLGKKWLYGKAFLKYADAKQKKAKNQDIKDRKTIIEKLKTGEGLAEAAIEWFWNKHTNFIANAKDFTEQIQLPFQVLNKEVDITLNNGKLKDAEVFDASLKLRVAITKAVMNMSGLDMPTNEGKTVTGLKPLIIHNNKGEATSYTLEDYKRLESIATKQIPDVTSKALASMLIEIDKDKAEDNLKRKHENISSDEQKINEVNDGYSKNQKIN